MDTLMSKIGDHVQSVHPEIELTAQVIADTMAKVHDV